MTQDIPMTRSLGFGISTGSRGGGQVRGGDLHGGDCLENKRDNENSIALNVKQSSVVDPELPVSNKTRHTSRLLEASMGASRHVPKGKHAAGDDKELIEGWLGYPSSANCPQPCKMSKIIILTGQTTTDGSGSALGDVEGGQHRRRADAQPRDESADEHGGEVAGGRGGGLHDDSNSREYTSADEAPLSSPSIGDPGGDEAGHETATLQGGHDYGRGISALSSLHCTVLLGKGGGGGDILLFWSLLSFTD